MLSIAAETESVSAPPRVLHLAVDELHIFLDKTVSYAGQSSKPTERPTEPAARAIMRAVMGVCNTAVRPGLFVVGTFAGTALLPPARALFPTDERCLPLRLGGLAVPDMQRIVDKHMSALIPAAVRSSGWFANSVLSSLGGLPRALEELHRLPQDGGSEAPWVPTGPTLRHDAGGSTGTVSGALWSASEFIGHAHLAAGGRARNGPPVTTARPDVCAVGPSR